MVVTFSSKNVTLIPLKDMTRVIPLLMPHLSRHHFYGSSPRLGTRRQDPAAPLLSAYHPVGGGSDNRVCLRCRRPRFNPGVRKIPWRMVTHSVFLLGEFHGPRSLVGCSPWDCKGSDMTEQLTPSLFHPLGEKTVTQWAENLPRNEFLLHARFCSMQLEYELSLGLNL